IAISLYKSEGEYSHGIFSLVVINNPFLSSSLNNNIVKFLSEKYSLFVASFLRFPFVLLTFFCAWFAAQLLHKRDKQRLVAFSEKKNQTRNNYILGSTDTLRGRDENISDMKKLAGRGWSAIAIVGRRGIGKTKILDELMKTGIESSATITAWISAPTKFEDAEFIESVLESLTTDIESAVSTRCNAQPLAIRRLETNETIVGLIVYIFILLIFLVISVGSYQRYGSSSLLASILLLISLLIIGSFIFLGVHFWRLQPIDLSSWLERDQTNNLHTVLLYKEMSRIRNFLNDRRSFVGISQAKNDTNINSRSILIGFGIYILFFFPILATSIISLLPAESTTLKMVLIGVAVLIFLALIIIFLLLLRREAQKIRGYTLMSLITEYRNFLKKVVHRIKHRALGKLPSFEVIICIDELDKIIDQSELRNFIRRIKAIFEIPGVYYYASLSEDALQAFYLGGFEGKNEFDSAFDHIIYIPPVNCDLGENIAEVYLNKHSMEEYSPRLSRAIAASSHGVPRDILRRCDEIIATGNISNLKPSYVSDNLRKKLVNISYHEERLTKEEKESLTGLDSNTKIIGAIHEYFSQDIRRLKAIQIMLSVWVLCLISLSTELPETEWLDYSEKLRDLGYRISEKNPSPNQRFSEDKAQNLINELKSLENKI
ncbi:MAG: hypothetical protein WBM86_17300, partial [Waterburya sp.]